ncbi:xanthine dehydrogenase [Halobacteriales archaeon QS_8_69_26]|nr:MAG: xanthine dehydrogenase [Halobacteriales archaeon QS_8_69_26]
MSASEWSVPESDVMAGALELLGEGREAVLATVVDIEGSAYRRPGAKMVITADGDGVGSITAGCLEDEVVAIAAEVRDSGEPRLETYDLMEDDDVWGLGVGCNGIIDILLEPLDESLRPALEAYEAGDPIGAVTVLSGDGEGSRAHYRPGSGFEAPPGADPLPDRVADAVEDVTRELVGRGKADTVEVETGEGTATVFVDGIAPPPELVVCGTGHDVGPVVELAKRADFRVTVVGFRGANATPERFPEADDVIATSPAQIAEAYERGFDDDTYAAVMTHNFVDDRIAVDELLGTDAPYVGLMGPRERFEEMLEDFEDEGRTFRDEELDRVYTPAGLDLGGGAPYQIALSIVAEALAVHNDRDPRHLKEREGPIHERLDLDETVPAQD